MISVVIVDDEPLMRTGLRLILDGAPEVTVVAECANGIEAIEAAAEHAPDVVLMDIRMPSLDGVGAARSILSGPAAKKPAIIMLTAFDTDDFVLGALRAGATGFLLKDSPPGDLVAAVSAAHSGTRAISPAVVSRLVALAGAGQPEADAHDLSALSERELEIAELVATGLSNGEIADELVVSLATVKTHVARVFEKLGARNRVEVAVAVLARRRR